MTTLTRRDFLASAASVALLPAAVSSPAPTTVTDSSWRRHRLGSFGGSGPYLRDPDHR
jgi:hypothetical protein